MTSVINLLTTNRGSGQNLLTTSASVVSCPAPDKLVSSLLSPRAFNSLENIASELEGLSVPVYGRAGKGQFQNCKQKTVGLSQAIINLNMQRDFVCSALDRKKADLEGFRVRVDEDEGKQQFQNRNHSAGSLLETVTSLNVQGDFDLSPLDTKKANSGGWSRILALAPGNLVSNPVHPKHFNILEGIISGWSHLSDEIITLNISNQSSPMQRYLFEHLKNNKNYMGFLLQHKDLIAVQKLPEYRVYLCRDGNKNPQGILMVKDNDKALEVCVIIKNPQIFGDPTMEFGLLDVAEEMAREANKSEIIALSLSTYAWIFAKRGYEFVEGSLQDSLEGLFKMKKHL